eukprot:CAMPEP_0174754304 /NCGR_PEP_ID=MMETSP1094-20130205/105662_1 /TAXON_ID=156173 /ORGANISM="Chrysochromulina brevifilum, Strain UTEX LB 985" /LENGTH=144 /DNA_ID=CAMNT_0015960167 /DNA_START=437 /DNA_END=869 /DNA_ORIENTATION=+
MDLVSPRVLALITSGAINAGAILKLAHLYRAQTVGQFVYVIRKRISIPSDKAIFIFVEQHAPAHTVGQFVYVIRKRISIPSDKAIFIFVNNTLPPTAALMSTVYEQHRDSDGFMYMMYSGENTFGEGNGEGELDAVPLETQEGC